MRRLLAFVAAATLVAPAADPRVRAESRAGAIVAEDLQFMSGSWQLGGGADDHADLIEEHWTLPRGGTLIGMSRTVKGGKSVFFEFLRVEQDKEGVDYVAQPGGKPPVRFRCTSVADRTAVFENPQHDFPTKITYQRVGNDELIATVSGPPDAKEKTETYHYQRAEEGVRLPD